MKTRLLGGIVALVVAIAGTVMLIMYVQGADKRALANTETQEVYVVQKQISVGTPASSFGNAVLKSRSQSRQLRAVPSAIWVSLTPR